MKILHTSDWHLGRSLYGRNRHTEFSQFLDWLVETIENEQIDVLLIAGDVFDSSTPSNRAQELYYRFLGRVSASACAHVVVIAGNHDSPSFLNAPKELLQSLDVHIIGGATDDPRDEVIPMLSETNGLVDPSQSVIICAVPYLRDRDVRTAEPGETIDDKNRKLVEGIRAHYAAVVTIGEQMRARLSGRSASGGAQPAIPIVALGHLFAAGGRTVDGDGVRELYVGSLAHVGADIFAPSIDYLALGHLHVAQTVGRRENFRYCGSPLPIGFGEASQAKKIILVEFTGTTPAIEEIQVPCFQQLVRIDGPLDEILARIEALKSEQSRAWLEIEYSGTELITNLRELVDEALAGSAMEIRRLRNRRLIDRVITISSAEETLDDIDTGEVFDRCLETFEVPEEERDELIQSYKEILQSIDEEDVNEN
jgi:exonuclease SbcD